MPFILLALTLLLSRPALADELPPAPVSDTASAATLPELPDIAFTKAPVTTGSFEPGWITRDLFEQQLLKVHGSMPDPKVGLFGPGSMMWKLTRYIEPGGLAAGRAVLMHVSHPWIAQGIAEHSKVEKHLLERGQETFAYALMMVYGSREQALKAAHIVRDLHDDINGTMWNDAGVFAKGSEYRANEAQAMLWVHATMWESMMLAYEQLYGHVSRADKDRFYEETRLFAYLFGIPDTALPKDWDAMIRFCDEMRASDRLVITTQAKELVAFLYGSHNVLMWLPMKYNKLVTTATIPQNMRDAYGFKWGPVRSVFYDASIVAIRSAHWLLPNYLLENPVRREALARIKGKKAGWFTRLGIRIGVGRWQLVP